MQPLAGQTSKSGLLLNELLLLYRYFPSYTSCLDAGSTGSLSGAVGGAMLTPSTGGMVLSGVCTANAAGGGSYKGAVTSEEFFLVGLISLLAY
jgi:hypothetical protein